MFANMKRWRTARVALIVFVLFGAFAAIRCAMSYGWHTGVNFYLEYASWGVGAGIAAAGITALICWARNRMVAR